MFSKGLVKYMSILKHFNAAYKNEIEITHTHNLLTSTSNVSCETS